MTKARRHAVIVGGGLIGIELAEMLHSRNIHVTFLVREASYWNNILPAEESAMINRVIREQGIDLRLETELAEIVDDGAGRVGAVTTKTGDRLDCQLVGLTAGVGPNLDLVKTTDIPVGREWKPYVGMWWFVRMCGPLLAVWTAAVIARLRWGPPLRSRELTLLLLHFAFLVLTLKARRFIEYWPVFALLSAASLAHPVMERITAPARRIP